MQPQDEASRLERVRPPAVAGSFYPAGSSELRSTVESLLLEASAPRGPARAPKALLVPHAGYVYSGPIAATAFRLLQRFAGGVERVVLVGPSHRYPLRGVASPGARAMRTPLGDVLVDEEALARAGVAPLPAAHAREHALEVELPFLQVTVPAARVVPIAVGHPAPGVLEDVLLATWGGPETVVVISSDLSHYLPYELGREQDEATVGRILALDGPLSGDDACGYGGVNALLAVARKKGLVAELLDLRSSGDTAGPRDEVVGYGAFAFHEGGAS